MQRRLRGRTGMERRKRWLMANPLCRFCLSRGYARAATDVDHVIPLSKGGSDDESNLQSLCGDCHKDKTRRDFGHRAKPRIGVDGWPVK